MTGKILTKELLPDTSSVVDKSDVNGQLTCEQAKLCVKLNKSKIYFLKIFADPGA